MDTQEATLRQIGEHIADPFVVTDARGRTRWVNRAFVDLCGHQVDELEGKKPGRVLQGPGTDARTVERVRAAVTAGEPCDATLLNYHKDGHSYWVSVQIRPLVDRHGRLTHFFAIERELPRAGEHKGELLKNPSVAASAAPSQLERHELVSICSSCKRIRNEQDQWEPFETYWGQRARARFSHGTCPSCLSDWQFDSDF